MECGVFEVGLAPTTERNERILPYRRAAEQCATDERRAIGSRFALAFIESPLAAERSVGPTPHASSESARRPIVIQVSPGDLVAVSANEKFYYALLIERIRMFGGCWSFVFHRTSRELISAADLLTSPGVGFNAFVDFLWSKREGRIQRLQRRAETAPFRGPGFLVDAGWLPEQDPRI